MTDADKVSRLRAYLLRPSVRDLGYVYLDALNELLDGEPIAQAGDQILTFGAWHEVESVSSRDVDGVPSPRYWTSGGWVAEANISDVYKAAEKAENDALVQISNDINDPAGNAVRKDIRDSVGAGRMLDRAFHRKDWDPSAYVFLSPEAVSALGRFTPVPDRPIVPGSCVRDASGKVGLVDYLPIDPRYVYSFGARLTPLKGLSLVAPEDPSFIPPPVSLSKGHSDTPPAEDQAAPFHRCDQECRVCKAILAHGEEYPAAPIPPSGYASPSLRPAVEPKVERPWTEAKVVSWNAGLWRRDGYQWIGIGHTGTCSPLPGLPNWLVPNVTVVIDADGELVTDLSKLATIDGPSADLLSEYLPKKPGPVEVPVLASERWTRQQAAAAEQHADEAESCDHIWSFDICRKCFAGNPDWKVGRCEGCQALPYACCACVARTHPAHTAAEVRSYAESIVAQLGPDLAEQTAAALYLAAAITRTKEAS